MNNQLISPYDVHVGEWVYGHHTEGSDNEPNGIDVHYPVCIDRINNDSIETTDGETYSFDQLSPIPFNQETVKMFNWKDNNRMCTGDVSFLYKWQAREMFICYIVGNRRMREKHGLTSIHEVQQWYYNTYGEPLDIKCKV